MKHFFENKENIRQTIMDHFQNPRNKGLVNDSKYIKVNLDSFSCVDNIDIQVKIENGVIQDFKFDGVGCALSIASTSILSELILNKRKDEALYIIENFLKMLYNKIFDDKVLDESLCFINTNKQPNRIKCASLSWDGLREILMSDDNEK